MQKAASVAQQDARVKRSVLCAASKVLQRSWWVSFKSTEFSPRYRISPSRRSRIFSLASKKSSMSKKEGQKKQKTVYPGEMKHVLSRST